MELDKPFKRSASSNPSQWSTREIDLSDHGQCHDAHHEERKGSLANDQKECEIFGLKEILERTNKEPEFMRVAYLLGKADNDGEMVMVLQTKDDILLL